MITQGNTDGARVIIATDLPRFKAELEDLLNLPTEIRNQRRKLQQQLDALKASELMQAQENLENEKARLHLHIAEAIDDKTNKPRYTNDTMRGAAFRELIQHDNAYKGAVAALRGVEERVMKLQWDIQEQEDTLKNVSDRAWRLQSLIDSARAEINAIVTFDGPVIPAEIVHQIPALQIQAPEVPLLPAVIQIQPPADPLVMELRQPAADTKATKGVA